MEEIKELNFWKPRELAEKGKEKNGKIKRENRFKTNTLND